MTELILISTMAALGLVNVDARCEPVTVHVRSINGAIVDSDTTNCPKIMCEFFQSVVMYRPTPEADACEERWWGFRLAQRSDEKEKWRGNLPGSPPNCNTWDGMVTAWRREVGFCQDGTVRFREVKVKAGEKP